MFLIKIFPKVFNKNTMLFLTEALIVAIFIKIISVLNWVAILNQLGLPTR